MKHIVFIVSAIAVGYLMAWLLQTLIQAWWYVPTLLLLIVAFAVLIAAVVVKVVS